MNRHILITGAKGFVGRNFAAALKAVKPGGDPAHAWNKPGGLEVLEYDRDSSQAQLYEYCEKADFVFHFAGVNRPRNPGEFMQGNFECGAVLLAGLKKYRNTCPVLLSSSVQAALEGRYAGSEYGKSKLAGETLFREYGRETGAKVLIYRFPNLFGKWCRPHYNSAVATFCSNIANGLPIQLNDRNTELELAYIDDVMEEMFRALNGEEHTDEAGFCYIPEVHRATLGEIADLLYKFKESRNTLSVPDLTEGSFCKKLYSTYLSYLAPDHFSYPLKMNADSRGSFTEILRTPDRGQFSVNISRPGVTKGRHWHHTKHEKFVVVSGRGLIQLRRIGTDPETGGAYPVADYEVSGEKMTVVEMIPGYTHQIVNLSKTEDLITLIWCNEPYNPERPDTFFEEV